MKFAHEFKARLLLEGFPPHWVESAVPYSQLKKIIKNVASELQDLGLDSATLAKLAPETTRRGSGVAFQYDFDGDNQNSFQPKLTLFIENGLAINAALSPDTRRYLESLVLERDNSGSQSNGTDGTKIDSALLQSTTESTSTLPEKGTELLDRSSIQRIEVPLTFDSKFFATLQGEVAALESLQAGEKDVLTQEIAALSKDVVLLSKPSRFKKTDIFAWRELFDIYIQANIFFSTHELDHGSRDSSTAAKQLQWFQSEVVRRGITKSFKFPASSRALERFVQINIMLLRSIKFQEINHTAITKILKKFDKQTNLGARQSFPKLIESGSMLSETMAKAVCSQLTEDLVKRVPQLNDYLCPICFDIEWRPVRFKCQHVVCISCAVILQNERQKFCPFCRGEVIMELDADSIDLKLEKFLEKNFPKEAREKRIEVETERGRELFGPDYEWSAIRCLLM